MPHFLHKQNIYAKISTYMEGQQVGTANPTNLDQQVLSDQETLELLWPTDLIAELSKKRNFHPWGTALSVANFIVASLVGFILGPMQLIILVISGDYVMVTEDFLPIALRISLMLTGLLAISNVVAMIQTWREENDDNLSSGLLGLGSSLIILMVWITAFVLPLQAHIMAILTLGLTVLAGVGAYTVRKTIPVNIERRTPNGFKLLLAFVITLSVGEAVATFIYVITQVSSAEQSQVELQELGAAQMAARIDGVSSGLSDLVFTLCSGAYSGVYLPSNLADSGIFECDTSHNVFAVSGPNEPATDSRTDSVLLGSAFYFGTTYNQLVSNYFPIETGAKYLYRDLSATEYPSELILLLPSPDEAYLIEAYVENLVGYINARNQDHDLLLSLFYAPEFNTVVSTKDYILVAAADTLSLIDHLPNGNRLAGYLNGKRGTYIYTPDTNLAALQELASSPLLYSSQTFDAIKRNRHITALIQHNHEYTSDELRELLWNSFVDPEVDQPEEAEAQETPAK